MPQVSSWIRMTVTALAVAAAVVAGWYLWRTYEESPWTRDGRVRANVVMVAPDVAGALVDIRVRDNQEVRIGDVLFVVDPARYKLAVVQAEAMLAGARSVLEQRQEEQARRERLSAASISQEALTQARTATLSAQADYDRAEAALGVAKLNLARTEVRSPVNGHVTNLLIGRGDYAVAGKPMVAVIDNDSFYVAGYFEETKLRHIRIGDPVSIRLMAYQAPLKGHVQSVARAITDRDNATGADLIANVNPTFSWVRLAQRIPVRIAIDDIPKGIALSAGMTATVVVTEPAGDRHVKPPAG
ncbi:MAG: HlyD family secretion protein [Xanthobacteraceae bacterium]|nr:HlyD family secretion protein [Xanthobacteraceae bacterium]